MITKAQLIEALQAEIETWKDGCEPTFVEVPAEFLRDILKLLEGKKRG